MKFQAPESMEQLRAACRLHRNYAMFIPLCLTVLGLGFLAAEGFRLEAHGILKLAGIGLGGLLWVLLFLFPFRPVRYIACALNFLFGMALITIVIIGIREVIIEHSGTLLLWQLLVIIPICSSPFIFLPIWPTWKYLRLEMALARREQEEAARVEPELDATGWDERSEG